MMHERKLALCISILDRLAGWGDLPPGAIVLEFCPTQDEPHAALMARETLVLMGHRDRDGKLIGGPRTDGESCFRRLPIKATDQCPDCGRTDHSQEPDVVHAIRR